MSRLITKDKPTVCLDFDGVFNTYNGYDGDNLGKPRPGLKKFLQQLSKDYSITIFSVRRYSKIITWLEDYNLLDYVDNVTSYKVPAVAYVDDRGILFDGDYNKALAQIKDFKPYWSE